MITKIRHYLFCLFLFLLPWQTRYMYILGWKNNRPFEYATLSIYATELLLGAVLFLFIIELLSRGDFRARLKQRARSDIFLSFLAIILPILFFWRHSIDSRISWQYLNWVLYGVCAAIIIFWQKNKAKDFLYALWWSGAAQGILAIWQFFSQSIFADKWLGLAAHTPSDLGASVLLAQGGRWLRAYGSFPWPNALGTYLAVAVILGTIIYLKEKNFGWWFWLGQLLIFIGLVLSFSRAAYFGAAIGSAVLFWRERSQTKKILRFLIPQFILAVFFLILLFPLFTSRITVNNYLEIRAISERVTQLSEFKNIFSRHILFGVGPGAYGVALERAYPEKQIWQLQLIHNIFLLFLAEWGTLGAILLFLLLYNFFKYNFFDYFNLAPFSVLLVVGWFDHWLLSSFTGILFLIIIFSLGSVDKHFLKE